MGRQDRKSEAQARERPPIVGFERLFSDEEYDPSTGDELGPSFFG
jgi:hypothetical protein